MSMKYIMYLNQTSEYLNQYFIIQCDYRKDFAGTIVIEFTETEFNMA